MKVYLRIEEAMAATGMGSCTGGSKQDCYFSPDSKDCPVEKCGKRVFIRVPDPHQELWDWCESQIIEICKEKIGIDEIMLCKINSYRSVQYHINGKSTR
jgi:hypothetical protein